MSTAITSLLIAADPSVPALIPVVASPLSSDHAAAAPLPLPTRFLELGERPAGSWLARRSQGPLARVLKGYSLTALGIIVVAWSLEPVRSLRVDLNQ